MTDLNSQPDENHTALRKLFDDTRKRLVETGTRNRLVHINRANIRGNVLNIINERSDDIYRMLSSGKKMCFLAIGKDKKRDGEEDDGEVHLFSLEQPQPDGPRYEDNQLEVKLGPDALQKRLLKIAREARTAEEEQGVNILYLALGFMTWFEDKSSAIPREAPLILLPVELVRNQRTSTYDVQVRGDDIVTNLPLARRLKDDFGLELPEIEIEDDWTPDDYFDEVEEAIAERSNWQIDRDGMQLGFYSFSKLLMFLDLDPAAWPDGTLEQHDLVRGLLHEGFAREEPVLSDEDRLDDVLPPKSIFHVVNADSSQTRVIEEVRLGRNLVVQGPPGTGKSQTITNIIAAAVREGKSVLFVAEKMAALSVVHDRLVKTGLADICLELHSKASNKKAVLAELGRTLTAAAAVPNTPGTPDDLTETRDRLNSIAQALHEDIGESGQTPYSVLSRQSRYLGMGASPPSLKSDSIGKLTNEDETKLIQAIEQIEELLPVLGPTTEHPFNGIRKLDLQPVDLKRLEPELKQARDAASALFECLDAVLQTLDCEIERSIESVEPLLDGLARLEGFPDISSESAEAIMAADDKTRLLEALTEGEEWRVRFDNLESTFIEAAFTSSVTHLRGPLVAGENSFFARWGSAYRSASRELAGLLRDPLPKKANERIALVDDLLDVQTRHEKWSEDESFCANILGDDWRGPRTNFSLLAKVASWSIHLGEANVSFPASRAIATARKPELIAERKTRLSDLVSKAKVTVIEALGIIDFEPTGFGSFDLESAPLKMICSRIDKMLDAIPDYGKWALYSRLSADMEEAGAGELVDKIGSGQISCEDAIVELRFARSEQLWNRALEQSPILKEISDLDRHKLVSKFSDLEKRHFDDNVAAILAQHLSQVPQGAQGEMRVIRGELGKRRSHIALRKLFSSAPNAIRRIKPVLLMSPISVAQFLEPGLHSFDLLVMDEASQVRPEDALGAIARARQIVVVGDQKQLPPTSFFDRLIVDSNEDDEDDDSEDILGGAAKLGELESVLSLCEARGLGSRMLEWHYRSRDPSLIRVSNREFYKEGLILPPSPLQDNPDYGLCFTKVNGSYDRGGKRDNRIEGEAIVDRVCEHARQTPKLSLGVVTFSSAQRNLITELLELARRQDSELDEFLREGKSEDFFVKNIENVQGDERDVILVSVGYGPQIPGGPLTSMSFGPVNGDGGERRLNVLFTRSRLRCEIFASFDPSAMDLSRVSREGPRVLKRFLEFAQSGQLSDIEVTGELADSPFEEDVADEIRKLGFLVDNQVGSAGFRIDLGVRDPEHPGTYILAVECDGATYHSALWARERDRLRQEVLEHLGWRFHRIWSTDWFYNRASEIRRLQTNLEKARSDFETGIEINGSNEIIPSTASSSKPSIIEIPDIVERQMPPYQRADVFASQIREPHQVHSSVLAELVERIVEAEGPIHQDEVARRVADAFGKERSGSRINKLSLKALRNARQHSDRLRDRDEFWFTTDQLERPPVRNRSTEQGPVLKASNISLLEIREALKIAREDNAGGSDDDLIRTAAQLMGFRRVGPDLSTRLREGLIALSE